MKKWLVTIQLELPDSWTQHDINNVFVSEFRNGGMFPPTWYDRPDSLSVDVVQQDEADDEPVTSGHDSDCQCIECCQRREFRDTLVDNGPLVEDEPLEDHISAERAEHYRDDNAEYRRQGGR